MPAPAAVTAPSLPAWRVELNEKVRAIRARRTSDAPAELQVEEIPTTFDLNSSAAVVAPRMEERRLPRATQIGNRVATARNDLGSQFESPAEAPSISARRSSSNIVEAALTRVKRASENASRAALPKIEPARPMQSSPQVSLAMDREATARALEPMPEVEPTIELAPAFKPEIVAPSITRPINIEEPRPEARTVEAAAVPEPTASALPIEDEVTISTITVIDELEPLDYLEAEIRKVDRTLGSQFLKNESPSLFTHAVIGVVDLLAVVASCSPFLATIRIADGSFSNSQTGLAAGLIVGLITFFYLALTQCICGRTFGMMLTNTRVVDSATFQSLSGTRALLRTVGYFISAAPAMLGFAWAALNNKHRGWQDIISRSMVVRDF